MVEVTINNISAGYPLEALGVESYHIAEPGQESLKPWNRKYKKVETGAKIKSYNHYSCSSTLVFTLTDLQAGEHLDNILKGWSDDQITVKKI